ncbi:MAG: site-specific integrase [Ferrovibrio sp.]
MNRRVFVATREEEKTTLLSCLQRYEREITPAKKGADKEKHRLAIWKADPLAGRKMAQVTSADLAAWRDDRLKAGKSSSTVTNDLNLLSAVFEVARKEWGMPALLNPLKSVSRPKKPRARDRRLKDGEEEKLLGAAAADKNIWMQSLIILAIETAARRSELLQMQWKHIHFEDGVGQAIIEDSKNGEGREIPLSRRAVTTLKALKESKKHPRPIDGRVFGTVATEIDNAMKRIVKRAEMRDFHFHDLRREGVSRLLERGFSIPEASAVSGHKTWSMLKVYTKLRGISLAKKMG